MSDKYEDKRFSGTCPTCHQPFMLEAHEELRASQQTALGQARYLMKSQEKAHEIKTDLLDALKAAHKILHQEAMGLHIQSDVEQTINLTSAAIERAERAL